MTGLGFRGWNWNWLSPITWMYEKIIYYCFAIVHHGNFWHNILLCSVLSYAYNRAFTFTLSGPYHRGKVPLPGSGLISVGRFRVLSRVLIRIQSSEFCPNWIWIQIWVPLASWRNPNEDWIVVFSFLFLGKRSIFFTYLRTRFLNRWELSLPFYASC